MKVVVVDDENDALSNFLVSVVDEVFLEYKMFKTDPLSSLDYARKNAVDAAFLDINMPEINGVDLAERLVKVNPKIRIVFTSGYTQDEKSIKERLKENLKGFCYKPYSVAQLTSFVKQIAAETSGRRIFLKTFGGFDLFVDSTALKFSSTKSKELLALLVEKNGSRLSMGEAIAFLWPDKNADLAKILYRDAVWRLRQVLTEFGLADLVEFSRAQTVIKKSVAECDLWDFWDGLNRERYTGTFMPDYDWSVETQMQLDVLSKLVE